MVVFSRDEDVFYCVALLNSIKQNIFVQQSDFEHDIVSFKASTFVDENS